MSRKSGNLSVLLAASAVALAFSACGGSGDKDPPVDHSECATEGARRCEQSKVQVCKLGRWVDEPCDTRCVGEGECQPPEKGCEGDGDCKNADFPKCNTATGHCEMKPCAGDDDCTVADFPKCNLGTGKCEAAAPEPTGCLGDEDCKDPAFPKCSEGTGKCVAKPLHPSCQTNRDCLETDFPRCVPETKTCQLASYGRKACQTSADCTDSYYSACNTETHECTTPCNGDGDCRICDGDLCIDTDLDHCNLETRLCVPSPLCTADSTSECVTACTEDSDIYYQWSNGSLVSKHCVNNSCKVLEPKVSGMVECELRDKPYKEECVPEKDAAFCSSDGSISWNCASLTNQYVGTACDTATETCKACEKTAGCVSKINCSEDSTENCNPVCLNERDGFWMWDTGLYDPETHAVGGIALYVCPYGDSTGNCINKCGVAQCNIGGGYKAGDSCKNNPATKYCTKNGKFKFECVSGVIVQKACRNNDCVYDAQNNSIISCTEM